MFSTNTQAAKIAALQAAYRRREATIPKDQLPDVGEVRKLGLLESTDEEKNIKRASLLPSYKSNLPK
jgi:NADH dehydrogenase (ubiquinone) Fe-S protein 5